MHVPYTYRCRKSNRSPFFYIQPFADVLLPTQYVELILDNNAFIEASNNATIYKSAVAIPDIKGCAVNPFPALAEQWVSNPSFLASVIDQQESPSSGLLSNFVHVATGVGLRFEHEYTSQQIRNLQQYEKTIRQNFGVLFGYLAVIRFIQQRKARLEEKLDRLADFISHDIPVFNGLICLAVLTFYAQANRRVTMENGKQLISTIDSFYAQKDEEKSYLTPAYLRNRAADLWLWYMMPFLYQGKSYDSLASAGTPIVVTADKFVASVPFRFIPPTIIKTQTGSRFEFRFSPDGLEETHQASLISLCEKFCKPTSKETELDIQQRKLENLFVQALEILDAENKPGFEEAWNIWVKAQ